MLVSAELISKLAPLELKARQIVEGFISGLHKSPYYGFSVEFAEYRPYNQGDEIKHIDWKVYAKSDRYYVKQYEAETNLRAYVLLDTSSSMLFKYHAEWTKLNYGCHLAAALMQLLQKQRDAVGLATFDENIIDFYKPSATSTQLQLIQAKLEGLSKLEAKKEPPKRTSTASVIHQLAEHIKHRSLIIIISDFFENTSQQEELLSALKHLKHQKHEILVFNLIEQKAERELDLPEGRFIFSDLESKAELDVVPDQIREAYKKRIEEYIFKLKVACENAGISYEEIDTLADFNKALLAFLLKRKRLH